MVTVLSFVTLLFLLLLVSLVLGWGALVIVAFALIPATIAHSKGRNFMAWWLYGFALWIIATPHAILAKSHGSRSAFRPDGILRGIPYRAIKRGEIEALMPGGVVRFHDFQHFRASVQDQNR
jgi:hypothetical protein